MSTRADRLEKYRAKRDFSRTAEPAGQGRPPSKTRRFVVQRHRARQLHYDLRLEMSGVLVSWAVPKGPTLDPKVRHLAVHVEDHPVEYFDFEGVIPSGEYGGGDVIVWDWGTWQPARPGDPRQAVSDGELHFDLHGEKLAGRFALIRRGSSGSDGKEQWILVHKNDEHAEQGWDPEQLPRSVKTGRTNDETATAPPATWRSDADPAEAEQPLRAPDNPAWHTPSEDDLAALDAFHDEGRWHIGGHYVRLSNLNKELFPATSDTPAVTKRDLIRYYVTIAPRMLPYLAGRPVNTRRFPDGIDEDGFWHKELPAHAPRWLTRWRNADADPGETQYYAVLDSTPALVWMANFAAVELHPWTSRIPRTREPTWALIDIDPGERTTFDDLLVLARLYRTALRHLAIAGMPQITGQSGIQIWIPVRDGYTFDQTRHWVHTLSKAVGRTVPDLISWEWERAERGGLARLDYTQNAINKTLIAPFSPRPRPAAPVSVPISWDDLDRPGLAPDEWNIRTIGQRVEETGDPLAPLIGYQQTLPDM